METIVTRRTDTLARLENCADELMGAIARPRLIAVTGGLGAGKTTLAQSLARFVGVTEPVTSPTFTLTHHYPIAGGQFIHADVYRLTDIHSVRQLELPEQARIGGNVVVVEWADRFVELFLPSAVWLKIVVEGERRAIQISGLSFDELHALKGKLCAR